MIFYHVSPTVNKQSIMQYGVDPAYAKGKIRACWYVKKEDIVWAIAHVSLRHDVSALEISVFAVDICKCRMSKFAASSMYYSKLVGLALKETPARWYVEEK